MKIRTRTPDTCSKTGKPASTSQAPSPAWTQRSSDELSAFRIAHDILQRKCTSRFVAGSRILRLNLRLRPANVSQATKFNASHSIKAPKITEGLHTTHLAFEPQYGRPNGCVRSHLTRVAICLPQYFTMRLFPWTRRRPGEIGRLPVHPLTYRTHSCHANAALPANLACCLLSVVCCLLSRTRIHQAPS